MVKAVSVKQILKAINNPYLNLYRVTGEGYWYFAFDKETPNGLIYETESVFTVRLNDLTVDQWKGYADDLIKRCEGIEEERNAI